MRRPQNPRELFEAIWPHDKCSSPPAIYIIFVIPKQFDS